MITLRKAIGCSLALALLVAPVAGSAQFGGIGRMARGLAEGGGSVSNRDGEAFLSDATRSTKNIMISASLLAQLLTDRDGLAGKKAEVDSLQRIENVGEFEAHRSSFASNIEAINNRTNLAADLSAINAEASEEQRRVLAMALGNLAIGIFRNVQLSAQAPGMVSGISSNPSLITRIGDFRLAAELLGLQATGLGGIAGSLPELFRAAHVEMPDAAGTTEPQAIIL